MILTGDNARLLDQLYQKYSRDPKSVALSWASYFQSLDRGDGVGNSPAASYNGVSPLSITEHPTEHPIGEQPLSGNINRKQLGLQLLIESYRRFGNLAADLDPLKMRQLKRELLQLDLYGLSQEDLATQFQTEVQGLGYASLGDIIAWYERTYCATMGVEYAYIRDTAERNWLQNVMEATANSWKLEKSYRLYLYEKLFQAEHFEKFLAQKYVGRKRFSIEGSESFIPLLDTVVEEGGRLGVECMVIGMAHRGRLNVLANILHKPAPIIFAEFDENINPDTVDYSDVKYHLGYSCDRRTRYGRELHLSLAFNPSHLEAVDPVIIGSVRARQAKKKDRERHRIVPVMIHGDASFMGQGVVAETLNLANLDGYWVGGTVHILINNQIGFTTLPPESRSTEYATDLAKAFQLPIFHVNSDDPEAVFRTVRLAMEYRQRFHKDVMIDLITYRRLGHNETDEPAFTQPLMYDIIRNHPGVVEIYGQKLREDGDISRAEIQFIEDGARRGLQRAFEQARSQNIPMSVDTMQGEWASFLPEPLDSEPQTRLLKEQLKQVALRLTEVPEGFHLHPKLERLLESRRRMYANEIPIDWGFAEGLALGSILENSYNVRLSGQDVCRGTFSHRHGVLVDIKDGSRHIPLQHISAKQGRFEIINSPLSEFSVLGFEYGYSLAAPRTLVIWEAQFGDFVNGAQIMIDQFISSSEVKWQRMSGLVMLLPHGYEGQGPEHSSARLERFLQLCANNNMQVCNCSAPAQYFHLLRRQMLRKFRKPLVILTPKSLLRLPEAGSRMEEISRGIFKEVLPDPWLTKGGKIKRLLLCSGKIYYDLDPLRRQHSKLAKSAADGSTVAKSAADRSAVAREAGNGAEESPVEELPKVAGSGAMERSESMEQTAIVRLEQLYPFPAEDLGAIICGYNPSELVWVQEEPINQGAWSYLEFHLQKLLADLSASSRLPGKGIPLRCVARRQSVTPGAALLKLHQREQDDLLKRALL